MEMVTLMAAILLMDAELEILGKEEEASAAISAVEGETANV